MYGPKRRRTARLSCCARLRMTCARRVGAGTQATHGVHDTQQPRAQGAGGTGAPPHRGMLRVWHSCTFFGTRVLLAHGRSEDLLLLQPQLLLVVLAMLPMVAKWAAVPASRCSRADASLLVGGPSKIYVWMLGHRPDVQPARARAHQQLIAPRVCACTRAHV